MAGAAGGDEATVSKEMAGNSFAVYFVKSVFRV